MDYDRNYDGDSYRHFIDSKRTDNRKKFNQSSKRQLMRNIEKKINTTMIGSLDRFEQLFGFLWGHGAPAEDLQQEERKFRKMYEEVRLAILDNGNSQLRSAMEEINEYTITKNKYTYNFTLIKD